MTIRIKFVDGSEEVRKYVTDYHLTDDCIVIQCYNSKPKVSIYYPVKQVMYFKVTEGNHEVY